MVIDGLKKAALKLYTLAPQDRDWILAKLDENDRSTLLALMRDLKTSGIKPVFMPFDDLLETPFSRPTVRAQDTPADADPHSQIASLSVLDAERLAGEEPEWIQHGLIEARDWPWRAGLSQRLSAGPELHRTPATSKLKPRLLNAILHAAAAKRLTMQRVRTPAGPGGGLGVLKGAALRGVRKLHGGPP